MLDVPTFPAGWLWFLGTEVVLKVGNISYVEEGMSAMFGEQAEVYNKGERSQGLEARDPESGACLVGIRVQALA